MFNKMYLAPILANGSLKRPAPHLNEPVYLNDLYFSYANTQHPATSGLSMACLSPYKLHLMSLPGRERERKGSECWRRFCSLWYLKQSLPD